MSWTFEAFHWERYEETLLVVVRLTEPGERCEPHLDVIGVDDEQADPMFALLDAEENIKKTWRPEPMQVMALEAIVDAGCYVVEVKHDGGSHKMRASLSEAERFELEEKKRALEASDVGLIHNDTA